MHGDHDPLHKFLFFYRWFYLCLFETEETLILQFREFVHVHWHVLQNDLRPLDFVSGSILPISNAYRINVAFFFDSLLAILGLVKGNLVLNYKHRPFTEIVAQ